MSDHPDTEKWRELAGKGLKGKPVEALNWMTPEGIKVKTPVYSRRY